MWLVCRTITELKSQLDYERLRREKLEAQIDEYRRENAYLGNKLQEVVCHSGYSYVSIWYDRSKGWFHKWWMVGGGWWVVGGGWCVVGGGWWLVCGGWWLVGGVWWVVCGGWWFGRHHVLWDTNPSSGGAT